MKAIRIRSIGGAANPAMVGAAAGRLSAQMRPAASATAPIHAVPFRNSRLSSFPFIR